MFVKVWFFFMKNLRSDLDNMCRFSETNTLLRTEILSINYNTMVSIINIWIVKLDKYFCAFLWLIFYCFRLGVGSFTIPETKTTPQDGASKSLFFPDETIFQGHPRFR